MSDYYERDEWIVIPRKRSRREVVAKLLAAFIAGAACGAGSTLLVVSLIAPAPIPPTKVIRIINQPPVVCDPTRAKTGADMRAVCAMFEARRQR